MSEGYELFLRKVRDADVAFAEMQGWRHGYEAAGGDWAHDNPDFQALEQAWAVALRAVTDAVRGAVSDAVEDVREALS